MLKGHIMGATIKGKLSTKHDKKDWVVEYAEVKKGGGKGPRGIRVFTNHPDTKEKYDKSYEFDPNPHGEPKYNKGQKKFYQDFAEEIAGSFFKNKLKMPSSTSMKYGKTDFTAS